MRAAGLANVLRQARKTSDTGEFVEADLAEEQWGRLSLLVDGAQPSDSLPAAWNVPPGSVVKRRELHDVYGGSPGGRVGASGRTPNSFLFLDLTSSGRLAPRWEGDVLVAPGHGQWGDMIEYENLAVLAHQRMGMPLRVFAFRSGECLYLGEFTIDTEYPVSCWEKSGQRNIGRAFGRPRSIDTWTPMFRVRQLTGVAAPAGCHASFREAPRISLRLHPSGAHPAAKAVHTLLTVLEKDPQAAVAWGELDEAKLLATLVQRARRQADLDELRAAVENPEAREGDLQKLVERMTWIFGGEFLPGTARRNLTVHDQVDLALLRPDGTLHGVELKQAHINRLVIRQRNHAIVGAKVNEAVGQAMNYLRELDEKRPQILVDLGIDCRRASMTVVIGHTGFVTTGVEPGEVDEAIRTYDSHLTRVSITTYDRLIENAQRTIELTGSVQ
ncbi:MULTISPECIES: Shedu anti-phage system protein SduA domain-containing protein [unclassified Streptomyces]|uniref:Shedu anti-phage system protein SduA domain-containing protein n=1 Tax=unclassified Streptomyces TaxID=2593676 RepID=UPI002E256AD7|nr:MULTISPECIES: Shedu anti-phage system protein SduA domain-containing protein [unclassified Streptomyces]